MNNWLRNWWSWFRGSQRNCIRSVLRPASPWTAISIQKLAWTPWHGSNSAREWKMCSRSLWTKGQPFPRGHQETYWRLSYQADKLSG